jgi:glycogen phosphorylase
MAQLAIVGSHAVNGVAELHTRILKEELFRDFYELWPHKFSNKTNGITPRRWLAGCNRSLAGLISEHIGSGWTRDLDQLRQLEPLVEDAAFRARWRAVKRDNKERLAQYIATANEVEVDIDSLFSCQIKRIHEYKRQLLNAFYAIVLYNRLKDGLDVQPRTLIFSGKAAPGYYLAKLIIKLINSISATVNHDEDIGGRLKVVFLANYGVSLAERIIPAADLSEQLSTAGMEASGTGNMKFALNGALTIGTLDGANIEIMEEVGRENIFIFGLETHEVQELKATGYDPGAYYRNDDELRRVVDMVASGFFCPERPDLFQPIVDSLVQGGDPYLVLADFAAYRACQEEVSAAYQDSEIWTRRSILNCARTGKFSSDRTIAEYARDIWRVDSVPVELGAHSKR